MSDFEKNDNLMSGKGEWDEFEHPRDSDGKFTSKGASFVKSSEQNTKKEKIQDTPGTAKPIKTPLNKTELVKKIRNFEPIKLNIGDREIFARFDKDGAKKIVYGSSKSKDKFETAKDHNVKLKNVDNLPEYIKTSKYDKTSPEDGKDTKTHKGVKEWHYFVNEVNIKGKDYNIYIDVRDKGMNQFVYFVSFKSK